MSPWSKKKNKLPPFVALTWKLLNSTAYKELPPSSEKALPYFIGKTKVNPNDGAHYTVEFEFSYKEGKRMGFAFTTFSDTIHNLVRFGFIDPVDKGGLRGKGKSYNIFKLAKRWEDYGTEKFRTLDWKCFIPKPR
jgi:hypothetical protein